MSERGRGTAGSWQLSAEKHDKNQVWYLDPPPVGCSGPLRLPR